MRFLPVHCFHVGVEPDVATQLEFIGDVVQVLEILRLRRKPLFPVPLIQQFLGKGVAIGVAFGVESAAWVTIAIPGAAQIIIPFERDGIDAEVGEALDLIEATDACADDNDVMVVVRLTHLIANAFARSPSQGAGNGPKDIICNLALKCSMS